MRFDPSIVARGARSIGVNPSHGNHNRFDFTEWNAEVSIKSLLDASHARSEGLVLGLGRVCGKLPWHQHASPELYLITAGRGEMDAGERTLQLRPGTYVYLPPGLPHETRGQGLEFVYLFAEEVLGHVGYRFDGSVPVANTPLRFGSLSDSTASASGDLVIGRERGVESLAMRHDKLVSGRAMSIAGRPTPRVVFVRSGSGSITLGRRPSRLEAGSYAFIPRNIPAQIRSGQGALDFVTCARTARL